MRTRVCAAAATLVRRTHSPTSPTGLPTPASSPPVSHKRTKAARSGHTAAMTRMQALATATDAGIIFSSKDHSDSSVARSLRRAVERGALVRLVRGAFFDSSSWSRLSLEERHRLAVFATASTLPRPTVFSHESAAVLCGIRMLGTWKQSVTTTVDPSSGHRSSPQVRRVQAHLHSHDIVDVGGILCTSPARTITDLSCTLPFVEAVAAADSALHRKRRHQLLTLDELADCAARAASCNVCSVLRLRSRIRCRNPGVEC